MFKFKLVLAVLYLGVILVQGCVSNETIDTFDPAEQAAFDDSLINNFLTANQITANKTGSGLYYTITDTTNGSAPVVNSTVAVDYVGYTLEGIVFDTSDSLTARLSNIYSASRNYDPIEFVLGVQQVIAGWDEGLGFFREGEKGSLFIPSAQAYGPNGTGGSGFLANTVLVFDIELVEVK